MLTHAQTIMNGHNPVPLHSPHEVDPFVYRLVELVGGIKNLEDAVQSALNTEVAQMVEWDITSGQRFLEYASGLLKWTPYEGKGGNEVYYTLCLFYFVLNQPPIGGHQNPIATESIGQPISPVSQWVVTYAKKMGRFMDDPSSLTPASLATFYDSPSFNMDEALVPPGGFKTFNQFFGRRLKPGQRPISDPDDDTVITWPADSEFHGHWHVDDDHNTVRIKQVDWPVSELLQDSAYAHDFAGGTWMHAFLGPTDYHRQHAPISGRVLEAKVIQGQAYLQVDVRTDEKGCKQLNPHRMRPYLDDAMGDGAGEKVRVLTTPDMAGHQFLQTRGCVIIENDVVGKVAVLPIGMAYVCSVVLSVQDIYRNGAVSTPSTVMKGDEISCFQYGGSDIVLVFQKGRGIDLSDLELGQHYRVGNVLSKITR